MKAAFGFFRAAEAERLYVQIICIFRAYVNFCAVKRISYIIAMKKLKAKARLKALRKKGVNVVGCDVIVGDEVIVDGGATLYSPCTIVGKSRICAGVNILPNTYVESCCIGRDTYVSASTLKDSRIGAECNIGPFAHIRQGAVVSDGCRIGDFVEIKNSTLGEGCKAAHLAYIGDACVGKRVNVGCGVVFANFDGKVKRGTIVEDNCFIGCNCNIIAPSHIGRGAYIAAATTVCGEVPEKALCVGRVRPKMLEGRAEGRYSDG